MKKHQQGNSLIYFVIIIVIMLGISLVALSTRLVMLSTETRTVIESVRAENAASIAVNDAFENLSYEYDDIKMHLDFDIDYVVSKNNLFSGSGSYQYYYMRDLDEHIIIIAVGCYQQENCDTSTIGNKLETVRLSVVEESVSGRWGMRSTLVIRDGVIRMNGSHLFNNLGRENLVSIGADLNGETTFEACSSDPSCPINPTGAVVIYGGNKVEFSQPLKQMNFEQIIKSSVGLNYADVINPGLTNGTDIIYYGGNTTLTGAQTIGSLGSPKIIIIDGDLTLNGSSQIFGYVLVRGTVWLNGSSVINGAVISASVDVGLNENNMLFNGSATLTSNTDYDNQFNLGQIETTTEIKLIPVSGSWREQ